MIELRWVWGPVDAPELGENISRNEMRETRRASNA